MFHPPMFLRGGLSAYPPSQADSKQEPEVKGQAQVVAISELS